MGASQTAKEVVRHLIHRSGLGGAHLLLRKWTGGQIDHLRHESLSDRFGAIYRDRVWLNGRDSGSLSGSGSDLQTTEGVRQRLAEVLFALHTRTLLDVGCGDFNWMSHVHLPCRYIGVDIVDTLIEVNEAMYGSEGRCFRVLDATRQLLPPAETALCREVLFHLSFEDAGRVIEGVRRAGIQHLIATTDSSLGFNSDIRSGDFRPLNLSLPPFRFPDPDPRVSIRDDSIARGRVLGVWDVAALPAL